MSKGLALTLDPSTFFFWGGGGGGGGTETLCVRVSLFTRLDE